MKKRENSIIILAKKAILSIKNYLTSLCLPLIAAALALCGFSAVLLYSMHINEVVGTVTSGTWKTQVFAASIGIIAALILAGIDYRILLKHFYILAVPAVILTLMTYTPLGIRRAGADDKAWLNLGFITFQPSEILKFAFLLSFAFHIKKVRKDINKPKNVLFLTLHGISPVILIAGQGDYGTALVFAAMFAAMMSTSGIKIWYTIAGAVASVIIGITSWFFLLQDFHKKRILILLDPESDPLGTGYQQRLGKLALSGGKLLGKGLFGGDYTYVPEAHNDFIFSYIGQTLGFVGCAITVSLLTFLCVKFFTLSLRTKDCAGRAICIGAGTLFFVHCFMNIGMVLGFMPVIGIPLPFLSAGGTAVVGMLSVLGLALSVFAHRQRGRKIFYDDEG